jgi:predicted phage terminase large subunit-like protein
MLGLGRYGTLYVDAELRRESEWVERAIGIAEAWGPKELIAEGNNTMGLLWPAAQQIMAERAKKGKAVQFEYVERTQTVNKMIRIRSLNDYIKRGQLKVRNTAGGRMLVEQLRDFPRGDHDDSIDALATAVIRLEELVSAGKR